MKKRAIDLTDEELTSIFGAATRNAALEAAQCGLSISGSVTYRDAEGEFRTRPALKAPSGAILNEQNPVVPARKRARAA